MTLAQIRHKFRRQSVIEKIERSDRNSYEKKKYVEAVVPPVKKKIVNYRKIYEAHYGPIPKQKDGKTYEVHHLDGNHDNNDSANLVAVTIQEHFDIHFAQGDYDACTLIIKRLDWPYHTRSDLKRIIDIDHLVENDTRIGYIKAEKLLYEKKLIIDKFAQLSALAR
jgi:hypothetical protein